jgi:hypothetical protein
VFEVVRKLPINVNLKPADSSHSSVSARAITQNKELIMITPITANSTTPKRKKELSSYGKEQDVIITSFVSRQDFKRWLSQT